MRRPFRILEDHVSYDERQNNGLNFHLKEKKNRYMEGKKSHIVWGSYDK